MNLVQKFYNYVTTKKSRTFSVILKAYNGITQWMEEDLENYAKEGYKKNVYVYSAIRAVSKSFSSVSWGMFTRPQNAKEDLKKIFSDPIVSLVEQPNPFESGITFRANLITHLMIYGNAYIEEITPRGEGKAPKELYLLRPDRIEIVPAETKTKGLVNKYIYRVGGYEREIAADKILHLKYLDPLNDFYGMSPIQAAGLAIDQNNLSKNWNIDILNNGGMPNGSLSTEEVLTDEQFESVSAQMRDYSTNKRGQTLILEGGLKYERFSMSAEDMGFVNATKMSAREISIVFGVPPEILGDSTNKTYNNYTQARKAFYEETIIPLLQYFEEEFGNWLMKKFGYSKDSFVFTYNKEDIEAIQEDINVKWEKANNSYFLTLNEKRNLVGYDDEENGEIFLFPNNFTIVTDLKDVQKLQTQLDQTKEKLQQNQKEKEVIEGGDDNDNKKGTDST